MQSLHDEVERTRRELQRLELYHSVVKRLNSLEPLMPELIRAQGLRAAGTGDGQPGVKASGFFAGSAGSR
jgi:hypothetical protein